MNTFKNINTENLNDEEKEQLKVKLEDFNKTIQEKKDIQFKIKEINKEKAIQDKKDLLSQVREINKVIKEKQQYLVDWLLENNKKGFSVDNGHAEIRLKKKSPPKPSVNQDHITDKLFELFKKWKLEDPELKSQEAANYIYQKKETNDNEATYWLDKKQTPNKKRKLEEIETEQNIG